MTKIPDPFDLIPSRKAKALPGLRMADLDIAHESVRVSAQPDQVLSDNPLNYDFDMCPVPLTGLGEDEMYLEARWRDPQTHAAMAAADPRLQDLFKRAGFGTELSGVRIPPGQYAREHDRDRHNVIVRLTQSLSEIDTSQMDWGAINRLDFFKAHAEARPVPTAPGGAPAPRRTRPDPKRQFAMIVMVCGIVLLALAALSLP
ncbi:hypothetical protein SAMN04488515_2768 [Cognatiyoonia koreensis]|uniref:Uncharacterized protein n=1 Tax=Cognatiyoonia koreensis TaxID=364200 RepID=A0A1I0RJ56_9RHOB|nr:hypothetical protein [Cognatiyoonia koreensis]SEW41021.1 hypothetical protein SAMN04488515_2768 [Cognatiyoonia koreensis]